MFENLFTLLRGFESIQKGEALILLTGDLFHNKHKLEPHGIRIAVRLLQGLAAIAPTIVIRGNHDYRQDAPHELDLISAIVSYDIPNLTYMDETGAFEIENVGFGLVAIQDTLLYAATSGMVEELPPFPSVSGFSSEVTHKVALFHGSVVHAKLQNGMTCEGHGYPLEWFNGYDLVLLGDIHLQQVHRAKVVEGSGGGVRGGGVCRKTYATQKGTWAYPGSLLQQDFGEGLFGHGLLHWDLAKGEVSEYHVNNPYGFLTLQVREGVVLAGSARSWRPLAALAAEPWFPRHVHVRVLSRGIRDMVVCQKELETTGCSVGMFVEVANGLGMGAAARGGGKGDEEGSEEAGTGEAGISGDAEEGIEGRLEETGVVSNAQSVDMWIQFVRENKGGMLTGNDWEQWLVEPARMLVPTEGLETGLATVVRDKNEKAFRAMEGLRAEVEAAAAGGGVRGVVRLRRLEWSWLFNFGEENMFDFEKQDRKICILNAKNGYGKSNFFEIVCIALFGTGFPSRFTKSYAGAILNEKVRGGGGGGGGVATGGAAGGAAGGATGGAGGAAGETGVGAAAPKRRKHDLFAKTDLFFDYNSKTYRLLRQMVPRKDNPNLFDFSKIVLYESTELSSEWTIVCQKKLAVDTWIEDHVGTAETFLSSAMLTQDGDYNFFEQDKTSQKRVLDSVFSLGAVQALGSVFAEAIKAHKGALAHARTFLLARQRGDEKGSCEGGEEELEERKVALEKEIAELAQRIDAASAKWSAYSSRVFREKTLEEYEAELNAELEAELVAEEGSEEGVEGDLDSLRDSRARLSVEKEQLAKKLRGCVRRTGVVKVVVEEGFEERYRRLKQLIGCWGEEDGVERDEEEEGINSIDACEALVHEQRAWKAHWRKKGIDVDTWVPSNDKDIAAVRRELAELTAQKPPMVVFGKGERAEVFGTQEALGRRQVHLDAIRSATAAFQETDREYDSALVRLAELRRQHKQYVKLPFNPSCDACRSQPWRSVLDSVQVELAEVQKRIGELGGVLEARGEALQGLLEAGEGGGGGEGGVGVGVGIGVGGGEVGVGVGGGGRGEEEEQEVVEAATAFCKQEERVLAGWQRGLDAQAWTAWRIREASLQAMATELQQTAGLQEEQQQARQRWAAGGKWVRGEWAQVGTRWEAWKAWSEESQWIRMEKIERELMTVEAVIRRVTESRERVKKIEKLRSIVGVFPAWVEEGILRRRQEVAERELKGVRDLLGRMEDLRVRGAVERWIGDMESRQRVLEELSEVFKGYRAWLYTARLGPQIGRAVNGLLVDICEGRPLMLEGDWNEEAGTFVWFLRDGRTRVVFEKASGFQRFIVGMAMRVAMSRLGICKVVFEQLFVDEGFTACDSDNLERVPAFLRALLGCVYRCIVLATHLEDLKVCGDVQIGIVREGGVSRMCG